jgi:hypothetical protein
LKGRQERCGALVLFFAGRGQGATESRPPHTPALDPWTVTPCPSQQGKAPRAGHTAERRARFFPKRRAPQKNTPAHHRRRRRPRQTRTGPAAARRRPCHRRRRGAAAPGPWARALRRRGPLFRSFVFSMPRCRCRENAKVCCPDSPGPSLFVGASRSLKLLRRSPKQPPKNPTTMATPADLACVYAALALADDEVEISVRRVVCVCGGGGRGCGRPPPIALGLGRPKSPSRASVREYWLRRSPSAGGPRVCGFIRGRV